jgi:hypothetical protein
MINNRAAKYGVKHHQAELRQSISSSMNTLRVRKQACNSMDQRNSRKDQRLRNKPALPFLRILPHLRFLPFLWNLYFQSWYTSHPNWLSFDLLLYR